VHSSCIDGFHGQRGIALGELQAMEVLHRRLVMGPGAVCLVVLPSGVVVIVVVVLMVGVLLLVVHLKLGHIKLQTGLELV
jgi:hypothetical protein